MTVKPGNVIRKWMQVLAGLVFIILAGIFILNNNIKRKIRQQLTELSPAIEINYSSLRSNLFTGSVSIDDLDIYFSPYATMPQYKHNMNFPRASLKGINFFKFILQKQFSVDRLLLSKGNVQLDPFLIDKRDSAQLEIFEQLKLEFKTAIIRNLELNEINAHLCSDSSGMPLATGNITISGLRINKPGSDAVEQFRFTDIDCDLRNINFALQDSMRRVHIKKLAWDGKNDAIKLDSLHITTQEKNTNQGRLEAVIPAIQIYRLEPMNLFQNKFVADEIFIGKSEIRIYRTGSSQFQFSKIPVSFQVNKFHADQLSIAYEDQFNQLTSHAFIKIHNVMINPLKDSFKYRDLQCNLSGFQLSGKRSRHDLNIQNIMLDTRDEILRIHGLKVLPKYGKYEFARKLGRQADRVEATIPEIKIIKPDLPALTRKQFLAEKIVISPSIAHIFRDRRLPRLHKISPLPMAFLKKIPFDIRVKSLEIGHSTLEYEEYPEQGYSQTGIVRIEKITASLSSLINHPLASDPDFVIMKVKGAIMGSGSVSGTIKMPTRAGTSYHVGGVIERLELTKLNSSLENLSRMRIKSGFLDFLYFNFLMDDKQSTGKIIGAYHQLVLQSFKKHTEEKKVAQFASFMLSRLIIPLNKDASLPQNKRTGKVIYTRDATRSSAYYLLQSLLTGVKASFTLGFLLQK